MSLYLSKSKKDFKPKATPRRAAGSAAPASATPSIRGSQEPRQPSSTPQPTSALETQSDALHTLISETVQAQNEAPHQYYGRQSSKGPAPSAGRASAAKPTYQPTQQIPTPDSTPQAKLQHGQPVSPVIAQSTRADQAQAEGSSAQEKPAPSTAFEVQDHIAIAEPGGKSNAAAFAVQLTTPQATQAQQSSSPAQDPAAAHGVTPTDPVAPVEMPISDAAEEGVNALIRLSQADAANANGATESESEEERIAAYDDVPGIGISRPAGQEAGEAASKTRQVRKRKRSTRLVAEKADRAEAPGQTSGRAKRQNVQGCRAKAPTKEHTKSGSGLDTVFSSVEDEVAAIVANAITPVKKKRKNNTRDNIGNPNAKRAKTPDGAEEKEIDANTMTMEGLTKLKIGRIGEREKRLREQDEQGAKKKLMAKQAVAREELRDMIGERQSSRSAAQSGEPAGNGQAAEDDEDEQETGARKSRQEDEWARTEEEDQEQKEEEKRQRNYEESGEWSHKPRIRYMKEVLEDEDSKARRDKNRDPDAVTAAVAAIAEADNDGFDQINSRPAINRFRFVDGNIVSDPNNTRLERCEGEEQVAVIERVEDDLLRKITHASFTHREPRSRWTPEMTMRFYDGLRTFGTDFGMVATLLPGMSRRQVKSKFVKEEKADEQFIREILLGRRKSITIAEVEEIRGKPLVDPKEWQKDLDGEVEKVRAKKRQEIADAEENLRNRGTMSVKEIAAEQQENRGEPDEIENLDEIGEGAAAVSETIVETVELGDHLPAPGPSTREKGGSKAKARGGRDLAKSQGRRRVGLPTVMNGGAP